MPHPALSTAAAVVVTALAATLAPTTAANAAPAAPAAVATPAAAVKWTSYTIRSGDTINAIARRTGTTVSVLVAANKLTAGGHYIRVGQKITVPTAPTKTGPAATAAATSPSSSRSAARTAVPATRAAVRDLIVSTAKARGLDPQLAIAIGYQESGWNQAARSNVGAIGVMQIMPANRAWLSTLAGRQLDLTVTEDNVLAGVVLLKYLVANAPSLDVAIGGYYQGLPSMLRRGAYNETWRYISSVKAHMARL